MKMKDGQLVISNGKNITKHKGYDNQPFFHPSKPLIYYSAVDDSNRCDIKYYNYQTNVTANLTRTREREFSPTVTPDEKYISCIIQRDNGAQDLGKYPIEGGKPIILISHLKIGYHAWDSQDKLLLFVLDDTVRNSLHHYDLPHDGDTVIAENIGRSLHKIPGEAAMSFIQRIAGKSNVIKKLDLQTGVIATIPGAMPGQDNITWLNNSIIVMSDGNNKLFFYHPWVDADWRQVVIEGDTSMLKGISRLAVNADNTKIAIVVNE